MLECAWKHGVPVRCTFVDTPLENAQIQVIWRLIERYGRLLEPEELSSMSRSDPAVLDPSALFRFERTLEPPDTSEGFAHIERVRPPPLPIIPGASPGVLFDLGSVRAHALPKLLDLSARGFTFGAFAWRPLGAPLEALDSWRAELGANLELWHCPHPAGPPICWCRPLLPGLPLSFSHRMQIDLQTSILIGGAAAHRTLAHRVGMTYVHPDHLYDET